MAEFLTRRTVAILALVSSLVIVLTAMLFVVTQVKAAYTMPMRLQVVHSGPSGFDLNLTVATFGRLHPGEIVDRYFDVNNTGDKPVRVVVKTFGELAKWVRVTPQEFNVTPEEGYKTFQASCIVPYDAEDGNYTGDFLVVVMRK